MSSEKDHSADTVKEMCQDSELGKIDNHPLTTQDQDDSHDEQPTTSNTTQLHGRRLYSVTISVGLAIFLVQIETTIVSTSLVSITTDLSGLQDVSWIVTAYLITFSGCLTILSKLSDIFGRKASITAYFIAYIAFSIGCGFSQSFHTLIILRAFQGIGAAGIFALSYVLLPEVVAPQQYSSFAAYMGIVSALASLLGPLVGGAISNGGHGSWRWIFWLNGPIGVLSLCLMRLGLPKNFPFHNDSPSASASSQSLSKSIQQKFQRIDFVGAFFLLGASVLLIAGMEEGATAYSWNSALPITAVIVSIAMWISFVLWERSLSQRQTRVEGIFPWSLMLNRYAIGALTSILFSGAVSITLIILLPQRFQLINGSSSFLAGVCILPLTIAVPLGAILTGVLLTKLCIPPLYMMIVSAVMQLIGLAFIGGQSVINGITPAIYGLQFLIGIGLGLNNITGTLLLPMTVSKEQLAIAMGSIGQFRNLGGSVVLAILANVLNSSVGNTLSMVLSPSELNAVLQYPDSIITLPVQVQTQVKDAYESAYQKQLRVLLAFSCCLLFTAAFFWERHPRYRTAKGEWSR